MDYDIIRRQERGRKKSGKIVAAAIIAAAFLITLCAVLLITGRESKTANKSAGASPAPSSNNAAVRPVPISTIAPTSSPEASPSASAAAPSAAPSAAVLSDRGTSEKIPPEIQNEMNGKSMRKNNNISYDDLRYLTIPHYDFHGNIVQGHLVVNKAVAEDVLDIFAELLEIKYPIERMDIVDKYDADDYVSIDNNNTSAFNYRESTDGTGRLSKHALGRAIDINPQQNPYVNSSGRGSHKNAKEFWNRDFTSWENEIDRRAYIGKGSKIYDIFISHGWEWGGSWSSYRDYQHFQKTAQ